jgi:dTDP-4-amino-4,6-dideoxygalactose transaminase
MSAFDPIYKFESALGLLTGAPFVVMTDCCTHALELCLRYVSPYKVVRIPAHTYISVPMMLRKLDIGYLFEDLDWVGEYQIKETNVWDSARRLQSGMYRKGQMQCLSFGHSKPLDIGRGGAILLDDQQAYETLIRQRSDGRDLKITPWESQKVFDLGYHYRPTIEEAVRGLELLPTVDQTPKYKQYPNLREVIIK